MSRLETIKQAKELCVYDKLVNDGIIPISINCWLEMYNHYETRMVVNNEFDDCKGRSVTDTAEAFNVCDLTIRRAVKFMKE